MSVTRLAAITIDYETWQPIPPGRRIDWEQDVFAPADRLMDLGDACGVPITFMAEMGEYFWLLENQRPLAQRMVEQWQEAVLRGHDVQLHLHPSWLPELGARCEGDHWFWDFSRAKADDYPGDLTALVARCKQALEEPLQRIDPEYRTIAFRAGTYQVQPFRRLFDALVANGILADTSVFAGGQSAERGYDFRLAVHAHQPWFANPFDPQLVAAPAERKLVEIPVTTFGSGQRWFLDNTEGPRLAERFEAWRAGRTGEDSAGLPRRLFGWLTGRSRQSAPARQAPPTTGTTTAGAAFQNNYFVIIGHTKAELHTEAIRENLLRLRDQHGISFVSMAALSRAAVADLKESHREDSAGPVGRHAAAASQLAAPGLPLLLDQVPRDRTRLLEIGAGGHLAEQLANTRPWTSVTPAPESIDLSDLEFAQASFDGICLTDALLDTADPSRAFGELHRVLSDGGLLLAAVPAIATEQMNPPVTRWRPAEHELRMRCEAAGFTNVSIEHVGGTARLKTATDGDAGWLVRGWKRAQAADPLERACEMMDWVYRMIEPGPIPEQEFTPDEILRLGHGLCMAYAIVLLEMLRSEGFEAEWVTMIAEDHPRGRGPQRRDSHEVVVLRTGHGEMLLDPMANLVIPHSLDAVLTDPRLATGSPDPDERFRSRGYELYTSDEWYSRVVEYWLRTGPRDRPRKHRVRRPRTQERRAA